MDPYKEQTPTDPYSNYSNFPGSSDLENSDSFMRLMIEVEETLQKFEMETLRRKRLQVDLKTRQKKWIPMAQGVSPVCNELGISEILGIMRGRATVIGRLTKKTDEEIMKDMFQFHRAMIELFQLRADDWDLDEELAKPLLEACIGLIEDIIFSSRNGFTAMNVRSQYQRSEHVSSSDNQTPQKTIMGLKL